MHNELAADLRLKEVAALRFAIAELEAGMWRRAREAQAAGARLEDVGQAAAVSRETARKRLQELSPPPSSSYRVQAGEAAEWDGTGGSIWDHTGDREARA